MPISAVLVRGGLVRAVLMVVMIVLVVFWHQSLLRESDLGVSSVAGRGVVPFGGCALSFTDVRVRRRDVGVTTAGSPGTNPMQRRAIGLRSCIQH